MYKFEKKIKQNKEHSWKMQPPHHDTRSQAGPTQAGCLHPPHLTREPADRAQPTELSVALLAGYGEGTVPNPSIPAPRGEAERAS